MTHRAARSLSTGLVLWLTFFAAPDLAAQMPAEAIRGPDGLPMAGYTEGFFIHSADRSRTLHVALMGQVLGSAVADADDLGSPEEARFFLRNVRLNLRGRLAGEALRYGFLADFNDRTRLLDYYLDWAALPGQLHLRVGRAKRPFSRQFMVSAGKLEFVDRALTNEAFNIGRDLGVSVHNDFFAGQRFAWVVGIFNGSGMTDESGALKNYEPLLVARLEYRHGAIRAYEEADFDGGPLRFAIALGGQTELDDDGDADARTSAAVDWVARLHHVSISGALLSQWRQHGPRPFDFDITDDRITGWHGQIAWVYDNFIQPGVRWASVRGPRPNDDRGEVTGSLSLYFRGHALKWQTDVTALSTQIRGEDDVQLRLRSQLQFAF